jgi:hypothetical protein
MSYHVSLDFSDNISIKSGGRERIGVRVKNVFLGIQRQLRCQTEGKNTCSDACSTTYVHGGVAGIRYIRDKPFPCRSEE